MTMRSIVALAILAGTAWAGQVGKPIPDDPALMRAEIVKLRAMVESLERQLAAMKGANSVATPTTQTAPLMAIAHPSEGWEARARRAKHRTEDERRRRINEGQEKDKEIAAMLKHRELTEEQAKALSEGRLLVGMPWKAARIAGRIWGIDANADKTICINGYKPFLGVDMKESPNGPSFLVRTENDKITAIERKK